MKMPPTENKFFELILSLIIVVYVVGCSGARRISPQYGEVGVNMSGDTRAELAESSIVPVEAKGEVFVMQSGGARLCVYRKGVGAPIDIVIYYRDSEYRFHTDATGYVGSSFVSDDMKVLVSILATGSSGRTFVFGFSDEHPVLLQTIVSDPCMPMIVEDEDGWLIICQNKGDGVASLVSYGGILLRGAESIGRNEYRNLQEPYVENIRGMFFD